MLFVVGHDAAHNGLTRIRQLNQVIGRLAFLPSLHAFSLWDLSHNRLHHRYNNVRGLDVAWEPMSPADYGRSGVVVRALYRFSRTPVGVACYYLPAHWLLRNVVPLRFVIGPTRLVYWFDSAMVLAFLGLQSWAVIALGKLFDDPAWWSLLMAQALPFLVWNALMSLAIYLHHTHPSVPWYADLTGWTAETGARNCTVCVRFPYQASLLLLGIMDHNAHHLASGVPLYNLSAMQRRMETHSHLVTWRFSWRGFFRICRRCKLYDYDAGKWVGFDGATS
jgi:omega-6 fatty acid desaturase (delta-12 desaturase)